MRGAGRAILLLLPLLAGCDPEATPPPSAASLAPAAGKLPAPPSIVLITLDTLRREHLSCYGYFRDTTPHIDAVAAEGLLFERALAPMASTLPSHLSMLTGLYPHQHGMNSNRRGASVPFTSELGRLSTADVLRRCGYRTAAFVSAAPLSLTTGIQVGFDTYSFKENAAGSRQRAGETNELVLAWLEEHARDPGPLFLWVHYFDPHEPSDPLAPYDKRYRTDERQREWIRARGIDPAALEQRYAHSARVRAHFMRNDPRNPGEDPREEALRVTLDSLADLMNRYDGELRYLDDRIGELLEALRRHGLYEESLLVLVADHGQSLGEDRWFGHGTITSVNTFVPLIVRLPRGLVQQPQRIGALVSLTDLMPTLLGRFDLPGSELLLGQFEGEDVLSGEFQRDHVLVERADDDSRAEIQREFALLSGPWKFVYRPEGTNELYDLAGAGEPVDVLAEHRDVAARLLAEMQSILARKPALLAHEEERPEDAELLRNLEALGYGGEEAEDAGER